MKKFKFLKKNSFIRPRGKSWKLVTIRKQSNKKRKNISFRYSGYEGNRQCRFFKRKYFRKEILQKILSSYFNSKIDVVLSDMAANTSGNKELDTYRTGELCLNAMRLSLKILRDNGVFFIKIIYGIYI